MDSVFRSIEKRARAVFHIPFYPLSFEDNDRLGRLGVAMSRNGGSWGKFAEEKPCSVS
jgi:hypothetical protein